MFDFCSMGQFFTLYLTGPVMPMGWLYDMQKVFRELARWIRIRIQTTILWPFHYSTIFHLGSNLCVRSYSKTSIGLHILIRCRNCKTEQFSMELENEFPLEVFCDSGQLEQIGSTKEGYWDIQKDHGKAEESLGSNSEAGQGPGWCCSCKKPILAFLFLSCVSLLLFLSQKTRTELRPQDLHGSTGVHDRLWRSSVLP